MGQAENAGLFLVNTLFTLYMSVLVLRIVMRWVRADFYNPLSQFIWQVTNPPVTPLSRVVPTWRQLDTAACTLLAALAVIHIVLVLAMTPYSLGPGMVAWYALLKMITLVLNLFTFTIFVQAILSWVGPGGSNPAQALLWSVNQPVLAPVQRVIPPIGGLDLSPLAVIIGLQVLNRLIALPYLFR